MKGKGEEWFWHVLALALGGRTVAELQATMTQKEFHTWMEFYRNHPFDDFHRYHRPAALISVSMAGGDIKDRLEWLAPEPIPDGLNEADLATIRAFGFKPSMVKD